MKIILQPIIEIYTQPKPPLQVIIPKRKKTPIHPFIDEFLSKPIVLPREVSK